MHPIIEKVTKEQIKTDRSHFKVGDGVRIHTKVREGDKERIQIFSGIVISSRGTGIEQTFTVRRMSFGVGVERIFNTHSPNIDKIEVDRESIRMPRSKLFYLRKRIGKEAVKVKEKRIMQKRK